MKGKIELINYQIQRKHPHAIVLFGPKGETIVKSTKLGFREPEKKEK